MMVLDIETLGVESNSVVLSVGLIYVELAETYEFDEFLDKSVFVKFNAKEQIDNYKRTASKGTLDWWKNQSTLAKQTNFLPSSKDMSLTQGIAILKKWVEKYSKEGDLCWTRGSLDQVCLDSLFRAAGDEPLLPYNAYRDIRTAIDFLYPDTSKNGYVDVDESVCIGFDRSAILKHHPVHDCILDAAMMLCGKQ